MKSLASAQTTREANGLTAKDMRRLQRRLEEERRGLLARLRHHVGEATEDTEPLTDEMDIASRHQDQALLLRLADKERKLLAEIDHALAKFGEDTYGICEGTGEPIGVKRLEARPWTRFSIQYKERLERERGGRREQ